MPEVCPACGVAVVAGYAKCPKCHAALPHRRKRTVAGGTVAQGRPFPVVPVAAGAGALLLILIVVRCTGGDSGEPQTGETAGSAIAGEVANPSQQPTITQTSQPIEAPVQAVDRPNTGSAANELERALRGRRLWSTIDVASSPRIDVRSASCDDPGMNPTIDSVVPTLRAAGLTRLRCLAQSGSVVFERDL